MLDLAPPSISVPVAAPWVSSTPTVATIFYLRREIRTTWAGPEYARPQVALAAWGPLADRPPAATGGACQCDGVGVLGLPRIAPGGRGSITVTNGLWGGG